MKTIKIQTTVIFMLLINALYLLIAELNYETDQNESVKSIKEYSSQTIDNYELDQEQNEIIHIESPKPDKNTKYIEIDRPDNFGFELDVKPEHNIQKDFKFNENYIPFVKYCIAVFSGEQTPIYEYSFLDDFPYNGLKDGNHLYTMINHKYEKNHPVFDRRPGGGSFSKEKFDYFYKSRVIYISEDADRLATISILNSGTGGSYNSGILDEQVDIFEKGKLIYSERIYAKDNDFAERVYDFSSFGTLLNLRGFIALEINHLAPICVINYLDNISTNISFYSDNISPNISSKHIIWNVKSDTNSIIAEDIINHELYIYSLDSMTLDYVIKVPKNVKVSQYLNREELVITFDLYDTEDRAKRLFSSSYLINLNDLSMTYLGNWLSDIILSPDRKHLIACYNKLNKGLHFNNFNEETGGFYIKNLETQEVAFYELNEIDYEPINWISKDGIRGLFDFDIRLN